MGDGEGEGEGWRGGIQEKQGIVGQRQPQD